MNPVPAPKPQKADSKSTSASPRLGGKKRPPLRNLKLTVEYDGTKYFGWQVQAGKPTVQGEIEKAVEAITGRKATIIGSGRTDAGVHALGQVANFLTSSRIPCNKWPLALNAHLPEDIRVILAEDAAGDFHSQFGAKRKTYRYTVINRDVASAIDREHVYLVRKILDVEAMKKAAAYLTGTHDYRAFGSEMGDKERTVRTIEAIKIEKRGDRIEFDVTGNGFLYNQVRAMVGTMLEVGKGNRTPEWAKEILEGKDRKLAAANVPAHGLCLVSVEYPA